MMPNLYTSILTRLSKKTNAAREFWSSLTVYRRMLLLFATSITAISIIILSLYLMAAIGIFGQIPSDDKIRNIVNPVASELYARDGEKIGTFYIENRLFLDSTKINRHFRNALIAVEDHRFYEHRGIDYRSLARVLIKSVLLNQKSGGGSTLTQQLVKNLFPRKRFLLFSTLINKFREMHLAHRFERIYTKDEILWKYCATVSFGEQAFGLASASQQFFSKAPDDLLLEEAALLAGILKATSYYSPRRFPERARERRNVVLLQMVIHAYLEESKAMQLMAKPLNLAYSKPAQGEGNFGYFKQYIQKEFAALSDSLRKQDGSLYDLNRDGLVIQTSLDYELHMMALEI